MVWLAANRETFDLIVSAEVFIYIGDLDRCSRGAPRDRPGRRVLLHIELAARSRRHRFHAAAELRYTHSERYLRELASRHGFDIVRTLHAPIREDQLQTVDGIYFYLTVG